MPSGTKHQTAPIRMVPKSQRQIKVKRAEKGEEQEREIRERRSRAVVRDRRLALNLVGSFDGGAARPLELLVMLDPARVKGQRRGRAGVVSGGIWTRSWLPSSPFDDGIRCAVWMEMWGADRHGVSWTSLCDGRRSRRRNRLSLALDLAPQSNIRASRAVIPWEEPV